MKRYIFPLALCAALLLSGCTSMLNRDYSSAEPHVDYSVTEDSSILRVETYQALVSSILHFIDDHAAEGTVRLYNYTGDVESDLSRACTEVQAKDPLTAYAVRSLKYDSTRILSYYEVTFSIRYSRSQASIDAIRQVSGQAGLRQELDQAVSTFLPRPAIRASYFSGDADLIRNLFWLSYYGHPASVLDAPTLSAALYPTTGTQRIIELTGSWPSCSGGSFPTIPWVHARLWLHWRASRPATWVF